MGLNTVGEGEALEVEVPVGWWGELELLNVPPPPPPPPPLPPRDVEEGNGVELTERVPSAGVALGVASLEGVGGRGVEVVPGPPGGGESVGKGGEGLPLPLPPSLTAPPPSEDLEIRGDREALMEADTLGLGDNEEGKEGVEREVGEMLDVPVTPMSIPPPVVGVPLWGEVLGEEERLEAED